MQKDDMIYRQAAIDTADRVDYTGLAVEDVKKVTDEVIKELKQLPSAQSKRKKGEWIPHKSVFGGLGEKVYTCNQCGYNIGFHAENYCSNCGAYMRGERDEVD